MYGWIRVREWQSTGKLSAMDCNEVHLLNYGTYVTLGYLYFVLHVHTLLHFWRQMLHILLHSVNQVSYSGDKVLDQRQHSALLYCQSGEIKLEI